MLAIGIVRYRRSLDEVQVHQAAHRAYVQALFEAGTVVAAGPLEPRYGGAIVFSVPDDGWQDALDKIIAEDPYVVNGVAQYEMLGWKPIFGAERLAPGA
jgi:uncharacterized protein YciI